MSYRKWWMRKFEFTQRQAVHEHEISKRVFLFPKRNRIKYILENDGTLDNLGFEDFVDVEFRADRLGYYTEQAAVNRIMLRRCLRNARAELKRLRADTTTSDATIKAVTKTVKYIWYRMEMTHCLVQMFLIISTMSNYKEMTYGLH